MGLGDRRTWHRTCTCRAPVATCSGVCRYLLRASSAEVRPWSNSVRSISGSPVAATMCKAVSPVFSQTASAEAPLLREGGGGREEERKRVVGEG